MEVSLACVADGKDISRETFRVKTLMGKKEAHLYHAKTLPSPLVTRLGNPR